MNLATYGNQYLQLNKPWLISKNLPDTQDQLSHILGTANIICYVLVKLLLPIIPKTMERVLEIFKFETNYNNIENIVNNNNIIILNTENYKLAFKPLDKVDIIKYK